jgi:hypothetical protein
MSGAATLRKTFIVSFITAPGSSEAALWLQEGDHPGPRHDIGIAGGHGRLDVVKSVGTAVHRRAPRGELPDRHRGGAGEALAVSDTAARHAATPSRLRECLG